MNQNEKNKNLTNANVGKLVKKVRPVIEEKLKKPPLTVFFNGKNYDLSELYEIVDIKELPESVKEEKIYSQGGVVSASFSDSTQRPEGLVTAEEQERIEMFVCKALSGEIKTKSMIGKSFKKTMLTTAELLFQHKCELLDQYFKKNGIKKIKDQHDFLMVATGSQWVYRGGIKKDSVEDNRVTIEDELLTGYADLIDKSISQKSRVAQKVDIENDPFAKKGNKPKGYSSLVKREM